MTSPAPTASDQALKKAVFGNTQALSRLMTQRLASHSLARFASILASESLGVQAQKAALSQIGTAFAPDITEMARRTVSLSAFAPAFELGKLSPELSHAVASMQKALIGPLNFPKIERPELLGLRPMPPRAATAAEHVLPAPVREEAILPDPDVAEWVRALPPEKRRDLAIRLGGGVVAVLYLVKASIERNLFLLAGALLGVAIALFSIYSFVVDEYARRENDS